MNKCNFLLRLYGVKCREFWRDGVKINYPKFLINYLNRHGNTKAPATFESSDLPSDADFALYFAAEKAEIGLNLLTYRVAGEDGYFLLLASPGLDVSDKRVVPKDVLFVLDTSGSMAGKKLDQAKKALQFCVENLNDGDRFEILRFATEVEPLFARLTEVTAESRSRARTFVRDLKPIGGTAIDDALRKALALQPSAGERPYVVVFLCECLARPVKPCK